MGDIPGSEGWVYLQPITPGRHPLEALASSLKVSLKDLSITAILEDLRDREARGLHLLAQQLVNQGQGYAVLVVDQFEELFNSAIDEEERKQFIDLLVTASGEPGGPTLVLFTLRADFYDRPMLYPRLYKALQVHLTPVLPMGMQEVRQAIEKPANLPDVSMTFEDGLVSEMLLDVQGQAGALPLLQFALNQLHQYRSGHSFTCQAYHDISGIQGALAKQAKDTYDKLPTEKHREMAHTLFLRLINPGTTDQDMTRRQATFTELSFEDPKKTSLLRNVADAFIQARLLTTSKKHGQVMIEVSHEALFREWKDLARWVGETRNDILLQHIISEDATLWERNKQSSDRLYRGSQLKEAQVWASRNIPSNKEVIFLRASTAQQMRVRVRAVAIALLIVLLTGGVIQLVRSLPKDYRIVTSPSDDGPGTLRQAVEQATVGDTITFDTSIRGQTIMLTSGDLHIIKRNLTIRGPGKGLLAVSSGQSGFAVFVDIDASVAISGLAFKNSKLAYKSFVNNTGTLTLTNCAFSGNTSSGDSSGGGIYNEGTVSLTNSILSSNSTEGFGGAIFNKGTISLTDSTISNNSAGSGGGIYNIGRASLNNSTISNNSAHYGGGGGIYNFGGTVSSTGTTFSHNSAAAGGGIYSEGTISLTNSTISNNSANGGIYNAGRAFLNNSTIFNNSGVGIENGNIYVSVSIVDITFCTIFNNTLEGIFSDMGGDGLFSGKTTIRSSIVAGGNHAPTSQAIAGMFTSDGYNLIQNSTEATFTPGTGDRFVRDLSLVFAGNVQLNENGALALLPDPQNPALNMIPLSACRIKEIYDTNLHRYTDQRGMPRPGNNKQSCDSGAYESQD